jgi:DNA N-6-adenine-methyltransferase (Dam)
MPAHCDAAQGSGKSPEYIDGSCQEKSPGRVTPQTGRSWLSAMPAKEFQNGWSVTKSMKKRPRGRPRKYPSNAARQRAYRQRLKRQKQRVYWSHASDVWSSPQEDFDALNVEFHFTLDACAIAENAKCDRYFTPEQDGLQQDWGMRPSGTILRIARWRGGLRRVTKRRRLVPRWCV